MNAPLHIVANAGPAGPAEEPDSAESLWAYCVAWAHRPRDGVVLPVSVATEIARETMEAALREFPRPPARVELTALLQRTARQRALQRVADERQRQGDGQLWHDPDWQPHEPLADLPALQRGEDRAWHSAMQTLRELATPVIRRMGVPGEDADDVLAETIAALVQPGSDGARPLDGLIVAEQLPALCKVIAERRAADHQRRQSATKRDASRTVALETQTEAALSLQSSAGFAEFDLGDIFELCADAVSPAQWEIVTRFIVEQSATYAELIADPRLMSALGLSLTASESTRRRRVRDELTTALEQIRRHLDQP